MNILAGCDDVSVNVNSLTSVLNVTGDGVHVLVDNGNLNMGALNASGDPCVVVYNGSINSSSSQNVTNGADIYYLASDDIYTSVKGLSITDRKSLSREDRSDLDGLLSKLSTKRTARVWTYREQLREILDRKQINVVSTMLWQWCTNVMRSKVEPMKDVASMIRNHFNGIVAWAQTQQTNGFMEALNGLF